MIHNILLIKNGNCIYSYRAGTKKSLDSNLVDGLLEAIFGMGQVFFQKKIDKIMFKEIRTIFRALSKNLILGVIEDIDTDNEVVEVLLKELSQALRQIILILEYDGITHQTIKQMPSVKDELTYTLERTLLKIHCPFLKKRWFRKKCGFVEKSLKRSWVFCNLSESKNCPYLQNDKLWKFYRTPFNFNNGIQLEESINKLGFRKKTEKYSLHILESNNGTTAMDLRSKLKAYGITVSPKRALEIMSKLEEKGFLTRDSLSSLEFH
jgi:hypothetical protein